MWWERPVSEKTRLSAFQPSIPLHALHVPVTKTFVFCSSKPESPTAIVISEGKLKNEKKVKAFWRQSCCAAANAAFFLGIWTDLIPSPNDRCSLCIPTFPRCLLFTIKLPCTGPSGSVLTPPTDHSFCRFQGDILLRHNWNWLLLHAWHMLCHCATALSGNSELFLWAYEAAVLVLLARHCLP